MFTDGLVMKGARGMFTDGLVMKGARACLLMAW